MENTEVEKIMHCTESIVLNIDPSVLTTAQEKGVRIVKLKSGKCIPTFFKKKKAAENEAMLLDAFSPFRPFGGELYNNPLIPIGVVIWYFFPFPKGTPKKVIAHGLAPMVQRPDVDNISKAVIDCMTKSKFWHDDSQITSLKLGKIRSINPRIEITIWKGMS